MAESYGNNAQDRDNFNELINIDPCSGKVKISSKLILKLLLSLCLTNLPPIKRPAKGMITVGDKTRPGLSARRAAARTIARQTEAGAPADTGGVQEAMMFIMFDEFIKMMQTEMKLTVEIPPGTKITGTAATPYGPAPVTGSTVELKQGAGIVS